MGAPRGAVALPPHDIPELIILSAWVAEELSSSMLFRLKDHHLGAERAEPAYGLDSIPAFWHVSLSQILFSAFVSLSVDSGGINIVQPCGHESLHIFLC